MFDEEERHYIETARIGRLATANLTGHPHVVPVCFALMGTQVVTPIDEKPQEVSPDALRRSRDIRENSQVALVVDHYTEDWSQLGWVQIRGKARYLAPGEANHSSAVTALREKYDQYDKHALEERPVIQIRSDSIQSWGNIERTSTISHYNGE